MHSEDAGIPTEAPSMMRMASKRDRRSVNGGWYNMGKDALTDIAPDGSPVNGVIPPNDRVDKLI
jgi:hypothetical protein